MQIWRPGSGENRRRRRKMGEEMAPREMGGNDSYAYHQTRGQ
uniref:Predicted protein n=1 Tax=Hordeum vulgare subsp. vulgare TaxID=112509 RepID=F2DYR0_HORVV|nr:predicted protein [Hordeum vulgare subsp. vulgare]